MLLESIGGIVWGVVGAGLELSLLVGLANGGGVWVIGLDTGSTTFSGTSG